MGATASSLLRASAICAVQLVRMAYLDVKRCKSWSVIGDDCMLSIFTRCMQDDLGSAQCSCAAWRRLSGRTAVADQSMTVCTHRLWSRTGRCALAEASMKLRHGCSHAVVNHTQTRAGAFRKR